jgi:hypothetical protein
MFRDCLPVPGAVQPDRAVSTVCSFPEVPPEPGGFGAGPGQRTNLLAAPPQAHAYAYNREPTPRTGRDDTFRKDQTSQSRSRPGIPLQRSVELGVAKSEDPPAAATNQ